MEVTVGCRERWDIGKKWCEKKEMDNRCAIIHLREKMPAIMADTIVVVVDDRTQDEKKVKKKGPCDITKEKMQIRGHQLPGGITMEVQYTPKHNISGMEKNPVNMDQM